jgi:hypothetical protein
MKYPPLFVIVTVAAGLCLGARPAHAQMLLNGGFENPTLAYTQIDTADDWTDAGPGQEGYQQDTNSSATFGTTPYGSQYVVLFGDTPITQTISGFAAGETYELSAAFADEGDLGSTFTLTVSGAATASDSFLLPANSDFETNNTIPFQSGSLLFTTDAAGSVTVTLSTDLQVAVDNVSLQAVAPEPATWAEMLLSCGALAFLAMFRRQSHS